MNTVKLYTRKSEEQVELGTELAPLFDEKGLIPCIAVDAESKEILMFAWMNRESLQQTLETGNAVYYSRSRGKIWKKGETSGRVQQVEEILVDCDQDVIQLRVIQDKEGCCHRGFRSCFYRRVSDAASGKLEYVIENRSFDPEKVYN